MYAWHRGIPHNIVTMSSYVIAAWKRLKARLDSILMFREDEEERKNRSRILHAVCGETKFFFNHISVTTIEIIYCFMLVYSVYIREKSRIFIYYDYHFFSPTKKLIPHIANVCKLLIYGNERSFERSWPTVGLCITNNRCRRRRFRNMRWEGNWIRVQFFTTNIW